MTPELFESLPQLTYRWGVGRPALLAESGRAGRSVYLRSWSEFDFPATMFETFPPAPARDEPAAARAFH
jgi:hypothetical protein